jgi:hypothetical protein
MARAGSGREAVASALLAVRSALGTRRALAERIGVSGKTLERYTGSGKAAPAPAKRPAILRALAGSIDDALLTRLAMAMEVPPSEWPHAATATALTQVTPNGPASPLETSLELAVYMAAERLDVPAARARQLVVDVLLHLTQINVEARSAHAALTAAIAKRTAPG